MEVQPVGRGQPEVHIGGTRGRHAVGAPERAGEHFGRRPSLGGGDDRDSLAALQSPRRTFEHDAAAQRRRRFSGEPADLAGEVELRGVTAARHVPDGGVAGVGDGVEELTQSVATGGRRYGQRIGHGD